MKAEVTRQVLSDVKVIDLSRLVAGNILTHVLADFGADVIKVEKPGRGDDLRNWKVEGVSTFWKVYCRNKRSLALDFRDATARAALLRLISTADVLVENFRPGTLESMDLGPERLLEVNPALIVVRISGWGQTGIWRDRPGFGSLIEAMSGLASMNGFEDRPPVLPPLALADMISGQSGATAVLMALRSRDRDGAGQVIDLSLFEPMFACLGPQLANYRLSGNLPRRMGSRSDLSAPRNIYETKDSGYVALSASTQAMAERTFRAIGRPDMIDDPRFRTNSDRVRNLEACDAAVAEFIAKHKRDELVRLFTEAEVTVGIVATIKDLDDHPFIKSRGIIEDLPDAELGTVAMHAISPRFSRTPGKIRNAGPALGQDSVDVLREVGLSEPEIAKLMERDVLVTARS